MFPFSELAYFPYSLSGDPDFPAGVFVGVWAVPEILEGEFFIIELFGNFSF